ncbi:glycerophosphodiester phosphodiesterase family protein [Enterococcus dongliensis]|uniref:Glycerophosphodiester phosphodiesterase family protein n=1 Tax=Enterococcus dongliensis TaxID=2559925 RepID=A0ABU3ER96_9ENTE|nr:glycerophosphodiester phosphodiesterase family protein [Enterococcus dongliensis]MDT2597387.1 glycerophosphodiester phosphodiesterase family protein [Enterococcus dongliensis]
MFKTNEEIIIIQAKATTPIPTGVVFWSHDKGTARLIFQLKKDGLNQSISEGTIVPVCLEFNSETAETGRGRHIYHAVIEDAINGIVSIVLEDNILGYVGRVDGSIYIELPDTRSLDTAGRFTFDINRSPIDEDIPELEDYYYAGFFDVNKQYVEINAKIDSAKVDLDNAVKDANFSLDTKITEVENRIQQSVKEFEDADFYSKNESKEMFVERSDISDKDTAETAVSENVVMTPYSTNTSVFKNYGQPFTAATKFIAHRGNNSFYPENSIAAFEKTSRHWGAETDIQLTTDGKWYCFHDRTLDRMTNGTGNFMDKTSIEIEALRLDTGNGISTLSDVEKKIPTFDQYLNACLKARIVPVIEITPLKTDFTDAQLDSIVTTIRRKGLLNKCVIICFTYEVLVKMRQRMPSTVMHWLISEYSEEMLQKCVINNFVPSFDYSKASVNQALIDKIHDAGLECGLWTVPYSDHQKYTDMGVDNITTDSASGNLRYFEPALRSGMLPNNANLVGPTYIEETSNGEIHIRVNVTGGQNDVGIYICALESWAIPRHSLTLMGYVRSTKVTGLTFVPVSVGVGGYSANDSSIADANVKFGYLTTGTNWEQRATYATFDLFYRI